MGRIARKGFEYYRAETDRFRDIKIRKLKRNTAVCRLCDIYQYVLNGSTVWKAVISVSHKDDCSIVRNILEHEGRRRFSGSSTIVRKRGLFNAGILNSTAFDRALHPDPICVHVTRPESARQSFRKK